MSDPSGVLHAPQPPSQPCRWPSAARQRAIEAAIRHPINGAGVSTGDFRPVVEAGVPIGAAEGGRVRGRVPPGRHGAPGPVRGLRRRSPTVPSPRSVARSLSFPSTRPGPNSAEPSRDQDDGLVEHGPSAARVRSLARGHRTTFRSPPNPGRSRGGRTRDGSFRGRQRNGARSRRSRHTFPGRRTGTSDRLRGSSRPRSVTRPRPRPRRDGGGRPAPRHAAGRVR